MTQRHHAAQVSHASAVANVALKTECLSATQNVGCANNPRHASASGHQAKATSVTASGGTHAMPSTNPAPARVA